MARIQPHFGHKYGRSLVKQSKSTHPTWRCNSHRKFIGSSQHIRWMLRCSPDFGLNPNPVSNLKTLRTWKTRSRPHQTSNQPCTSLTLAFAPSPFYSSQMLILPHKLTLRRDQERVITESIFSTMPLGVSNTFYPGIATALLGLNWAPQKTYGNILPIDQQAEAQGALTSRYYILFVIKKQSGTQMSSYSSLTSMVSQVALSALNPNCSLWSSSTIKYKCKVGFK